MSKRIRELLIKTYVKSQNSVKFGMLAFGVYIAGVSVFMETFSHAKEGMDIVDIATQMLNDLSGTMLKLSTAAALIGVGTGAFFKKLSFGKPDRIETGNKLIVNSIWGWILLNGLTRILAWVGGYLDVDITLGNDLINDQPADTTIQPEVQQPVNDLIIDN